MKRFRGGLGHCAAVCKPASFCKVHAREGGRKWEEEGGGQGDRILKNLENGSIYFTILLEGGGHRLSSAVGEGTTIKHIHILYKTCIIFAMQLQDTCTRRHESEHQRLWIQDFLLPLDIVNQTYRLGPALGVKTPVQCMYSLYDTGIICKIHV